MDRQTREDIAEMLLAAYLSRKPVNSPAAVQVVVARAGNAGVSAVVDGDPGSFRRAQVAAGRP